MRAASVTLLDDDGEPGKVPQARPRAPSVVVCRYRDRSALSSMLQARQGIWMGGLLPLEVQRPPVKDRALLGNLHDIVANGGDGDRSDCLRSLSTGFGRRTVLSSYARGHLLDQFVRRDELARRVLIEPSGRNELEVDDIGWLFASFEKKARIGRRSFVVAREYRHPVECALPGVVAGRWQSTCRRLRRCASSPKPRSERSTQDLVCGLRQAPDPPTIRPIAYRMKSFPQTNRSVRFRAARVALMCLPRGDRCPELPDGLCTQAHLHEAVDLSVISVLPDAPVRREYT